MVSIALFVGMILGYGTSWLDVIFAGLLLNPALGPGMYAAALWRSRRGGSGPPAGWLYFVPASGLLVPEGWLLGGPLLFVWGGISLFLAFAGVYAIVGFFERRPPAPASLRAAWFGTLAALVYPAALWTSYRFGASTTNSPFG